MINASCLPSAAGDLPNRASDAAPIPCASCGKRLKVRAALAGTKNRCPQCGKVMAAPHGMHFDAYRNKLVRTWRPGGNRHPLQRLTMAIIKRRRAAQGA